MTGRRPIATVHVGEVLPAQVFTLRRDTLVRYAGASGDFNPIHWSEREARAVGLPGVIAHGMLTMAESVRVVTDWAGDPGAVVDYAVRFSQLVPVPDDDFGVQLEVAGVVSELLEGDRVRVDLAVSCLGTAVLTRAHAVVQLS